MCSKCASNSKLVELLLRVVTGKYYVKDYSRFYNPFYFQISGVGKATDGPSNSESMAF